MRDTYIVLLCIANFWFGVFFYRWLQRSDNKGIIKGKAAKEFYKNSSLGSLNKD